MEIYRKIAKNLDTQKICSNHPEIEQGGVAMKLCVQKMETEWQTV